MNPTPGAPALARRPWLLGLGATLGLATAMVGILEPGPAANALLPDDAVATINGEPLSREIFERAVGSLAADSRNPLGAPERQRVLERLIDEELLVQRARELGLDRHEGRVRALLVRALIDSILADAEADTPDDAAVQTFYEENRDYFASTARIAVETHRIGQRAGENADATRQRAMEATRRLRAGESATLVDAAVADPQIAAIPTGLLPAAKLRQDLGPTPTQQALRLAVGDVSDPVESGGSWWVVRMLEREPGEIPPLAEVEDQIRAEMRRRAGESALRRYLDELRARSDVQRETPEG